MKWDRIDSWDQIKNKFVVQHQSGDHDLATHGENPTRREAGPPIGRMAGSVTGADGLIDSLAKQQH